MDISKLYTIFQQYPHICTDSRMVRENSLFFALKGESFDGNKFARGAIEKGAAYAIIDNAAYKMGERYILVEDVLLTLQELAAYHRKQFDIPVFGLTGSNGKTTTKELIAAVLSEKFKVHATSGNYNNHIGVPLTLLAMPLDTEVAVIEMGANHPGEIAFLSKIAAPNLGLVTNVGKAHLEGFGSFEGVRKTKAELYDWLANNDGTGLVNANEPYLEEMSANVKNRHFYGGKEASVSLIDASPFVKFSLDGKTVSTNLIGAYNFNNILTAVTLGNYFKVPSEAIKRAMENYQPKNNRSQLLKKEGLTFIMDAYNANPVSMEKALSSFSKMKNESGKKIAIIGDMLELGEVSELEHQKIVNLCCQLDIDQTVHVGKEFGKVVDQNKHIHFENAEQAKSWFYQQNFKNELILLKGSRGIKLESLIN